MAPVPSAAPGRAFGREVRTWLAARHSLPVEVSVMVVVYLAYDAARGLAGGGRQAAVANARRVVDLEKGLRLAPEHEIQRLAGQIPGADRLFGFGYDTFHLGVTALVLLWLYRRRPDSYSKARTAVVVATGLALIGFVVFPTAPPRAAGIGISDTLDLGRETARSGLLRLLYNPYAAMPSVHIAFAVIAGGWIAASADRKWVKVIGVAYPLYVAVEVIATGNHFLADVVLGAITGLLGERLAVRIVSLDNAVVGSNHYDATIQRLSDGRFLLPWPQIERGGLRGRSGSYLGWRNRYRPSNGASRR